MQLQEEKALNVAIKASEIAAKFLVENNIDRSISIKKDGSPLTSLDVLSQELIIKHIKSQFPNDSILAEESEQISGNNSRLWIIDPIDGTANYANSFPMCGINISLRSDSKPIVSITRSIFQNEYMYRILESPIVYCGEFLNPKDCSGHVIVDSIPADVNRTEIKNLADKFYNARLPIRSVGSAAIGIMYVILGRASAYFAPRLHIWDIAPGLHFANNDENFMIVNLELKRWKESDVGFGIIRKDCKVLKKALGGVEWE